MAPYADIDQQTGRVLVDAQTGRCKWMDVEKSKNGEKEQRSPPPVWCGGDASVVSVNSVAPSQTTVESANDGKTAAYYIHQYLQVR